MTGIEESRDKNRLRILHLPVIVLNQATLYCQAVRHLGHTSDYLL